MGQSDQYATDDLEMNMTPMIDIVFLLIIFFMIVTEISQLVLEDLQLPYAPNAKDDEKPPKDRLVINITDDGGIKVAGKLVDKDALRSRLMVEANLDRDPDQPHISNRPVLIRADYSTEWQHVQRVLTECAMDGVGIWKIEIGATKKEN